MTAFEEGKPAVTRRGGLPRRLLAALAVVLAAAVLLFGTMVVWRMANTSPAEGARKSLASDAEEWDYGAPAPLPLMAEGASADTQAKGGSILPDKVIRTFSFTLSTRQFEKDLQALREKLQTHGGYVEESSLSGDVNAKRKAYMKARVPKANVDAFVADLAKVGRTLNVQETAEDVSERYSDTALRLATQTAKLTRLQEMLRQAVSVEELLRIESAIADTQYEVDSLQGALKGMDSRVDYATVSITLTEEKDAETAAYREEGLEERIRSAFSAMLHGIRAFLEDAAVLLVYLLPLVVLLLAAAVILAIRIKKRRNRK